MCARESEEGRGGEESGSRCALQLHSSPRAAVCRLCEGVNQDYSGENTLFSAIRRHWGWARCMAHASLRGTGNKWLITAGRGTIHSPCESDYKAVMRNGHLVSNNQKHLISHHKKKLKTSYKRTKDEVFGIGPPNSEAVFLAQGRRLQQRESKTQPAQRRDCCCGNIPRIKLKYDSENPAG